MISGYYGHHPFPSPVDVDVVIDGDGDGDELLATAPTISRQPGVLSFQKLDVYQCSVEFVALAVEIALTIPRGHGALSDQLRRAAFSVPLNIAEAAGRASKVDGARHYAIARGSAMESAAVLDVVRCLGALNEDRYHRGLELLARIVAMLTKLCR